MSFKPLFAATLVIAGILSSAALAQSAPVGPCQGKTVEWTSGDFLIAVDLWANPQDEIGEIRHVPTGKVLDVFSVNLGTDGKHGSWNLAIADRKCRDADDCDLEGDIEVLQPATGSKEPPQSLRFIGLGDSMATQLKPGYWPGGAKPDDKFDLTMCRD